MKCIIRAERNRANKNWQITIIPTRVLLEEGQVYEPRKNSYHTEFKTKKEAQEWGRQILKKEGLKDEDITYEDETF